eukprot:3244598-Pyramimonas_sp.AAC.1
MKIRYDHCRDATGSKKKQLRNKDETHRLATNVTREPQGGRRMRKMRKSSRIKRNCNREVPSDQ